MPESKGLIRKIDELGRIVIPIELRRQLNIHPNDSLEITVQGDAFLIRKNVPYCFFCGSHINLIPHKGYLICEKCAQEIVKSRPFCAFCGTTSVIKPFRGSWICVYCSKEICRSIVQESESDQ